MSKSNSRSDQVIDVSVLDGTVGDCISPKFARELERRLVLSIPDETDPGDAVVSRTPPDDKSVIWYPADENGFPIGTAYVWDPLKGQWVNTVEEPPAPTCLTDDASNLIQTDANGCLSVTVESINQLINDGTLKISGDSGNAVRLGSDGGIYVPGDLGGGGTEGQVLILSSPITVGSGTEADTGPTDLSALTSVPSWATHAIVRGVVWCMSKDKAFANTDKAYGRLFAGGITTPLAEVGPNPGPNTISGSNGTNTNDGYAVISESSLAWDFTVNKPDARDEVSFTLLLLGFIRAGIE